VNLLSIALALSLSGLALSLWYFGYTTGRKLAERASSRQRRRDQAPYLTRIKIHHARHRRGQARGDWGGPN